MRPDKIITLQPDRKHSGKHHAQFLVKLTLNQWDEYHLCINGIYLIRNCMHWHT